MGLLTALDFYKKLQFGIKEESIEVEYRLYSWGEIFPPFLGNREHSIDARWILREFPFKLFCSSIPYDPLPQKLCLQFKSPVEKRQHKETFHSIGIFPHEIAKEFSAFLSLITRRRVFAEKQIRYSDLPIEQEADFYHRSHFQERQNLKEIDPSEIYQLLENLQAMDRRIANGFILAMRLYHSAVEMMFTEPEFSYLFLVTCLEAISSVIYEDYKPDDEEEFLDQRKQGWRDLSKTLSPEDGIILKNLLLKNEKFTFKKLSKFVNENLSEVFWSETEDDAKPNYYSIIIGAGANGFGQEKLLRSDKTIQAWEKIEKENLSKVLRDIYNSRSDLIHKGIRLTPSIVVGHFRGIPFEALAEIMPISQANNSNQIEIPPLLTFERLVSYSMVEFLRK